MKLFFFLLLSLVSCQDYNSNSGDRGRYGPVQLNESDPNFAEAYRIIQTRCVSCHDGTHNNWADLKSHDEWLADNNNIVPGNPANSDLIIRIINTGAGSLSNMPPGGSPLPDAEYNHLKDWITNFQ